MRIWFDTEFQDTGRTIEPISIGMVREDGATYYAEFAEYDRSAASDWLRKHVLPQLTGPVKPGAQIREEIAGFCGDDPEFWAYYAAYDWVLMCQMFGGMMRLPPHWPKHCLDLRQEMAAKGIRSIQRPEGGDHNALADAAWVERAWSEVVRWQ